MLKPSPYVDSGGPKSRVSAAAASMQRKLEVLENGELLREVRSKLREERARTESLRVEERDLRGYIS